MRPRVTNRKVAPTITCNPWNPVATKNTDPNVPSYSVNIADLYSLHCNNVK